MTAATVTYFLLTAVTMLNCLVKATMHTYNMLTTVEFNCRHCTRLGVDDHKYEWIATTWGAA